MKEHPKVPQYDVHQRIIVRVKFRNIDAANHLAAIQSVEDNQDLGRIARNAIQNSYDQGPIADIEADDGEPAVSYLVDLVGDEDYLHTLDFVLLPDGGYAQRAPEIRTPPGILESAALLAVDPDKSISSPSAPTNPAVALIQIATAGLSIDERDTALARLDHAIATLNTARAAVVGAQ